MVTLCIYDGIKDKNAENDDKDECQLLFLDSGGALEPKIVVSLMSTHKTSGVTRCRQTTQSLSVYVLYFCGGYCQHDLHLYVFSDFVRGYCQHNLDLCMFSKF